VPPNLDYFNGVNPLTVLSQSFDEAVFGLAAAMGQVPSSWTAPRGFIEVRHTLLGTLATFPLGNRSTYAQIVQLKNPSIDNGRIGNESIDSESILPLGQSGMIRLDPTAPTGIAFDPNFFSQLGLFTRMEYKPAPLYRNTQLHD